MPRAFIVGGTGQIGLAAAARLARDGWEVDLASRSAGPSGPWRHVALDRTEAGALARALGPGADLVLDCVAYGAGDAAQLVEVADRAGRIVAVSSAAVYADAEGRGFGEPDWPRYPVPIPEDQPTVAPGPGYAGGKVAMERALLAGVPARAHVLRPCAIHGARSAHAREWWFVKRLLDGRARIPLRDEGRSRFHTTSAAGIADAVARLAASGGPPAVNVADADAPTVLEIGRTIMSALGREAELVPLGDAPGDVGRTPWSAPGAVVVASSMPPAGTYAETVPDALRWLTGEVAGGDWRAMLPQLAAYPRDHFDYAAEDAVLEGR